MPQLFGRDLRAGDLMMKFSGGSKVNRLIAYGQQKVGHMNSQVVHAGVMFDNRFIIESQGAGVSANDLYLQNQVYGYLVFRPRNQRLAGGAATCAKMLFDVHQRYGKLKYSLSGAARSIFGSGKAKSEEQLEKLMDRILEGKSSPFFCSRLVVYIYQFVAAQNGLPPEAIFPMSDAKASPAALATNLARNGNFTEAGYVMPGERT